MLPIAASHKPRCGDVAPSRRAKWRAVVLIVVHLVIVAHVLHWQFAGKTMTPLEPSEAMQTFELGLVNAGFVLFVIATLATLIFGRFFCGWACHVVAYQDLCAWLLGKLGLRPRPLRSRLLVFVPLGAAFYMFVWPTIKRLDAGGEMPAFVAHFTTDDLWRTFPGPWMGTLTLVVCGALVVWFFGAKGFCTYGCPYGAVFGVADRAAPVRIRVTDACEGCGHCTAVCTSNVRVHQEVALHKMVVDPGCMKCLDCVSVCPKEALYVGFGPPAITSAKAKSRRVYDLTWREELLAAATFIGALYSYRELYHAVPFLLAIGLSTCVAAAMLVVTRALKRRDFTFQHVVARREGRFTPRGAALLAALLALLAFTVHSAVVQYHSHEGVRRMTELRAARGPVEPARYEAALESFTTADTLGLFPDGHVDLAISSLAERLGNRDLALERARAAVAHNPRLAQGYLQLASLLQRDGNRDEAEQVLLRLLDREPSDARARAQLEALRK
jgi:polyferredoxin